MEGAAGNSGAREELFGVEQCKLAALRGWVCRTLLLSTVALLCVWALQGYSAVGHCWHTLRLGTARILTYFVKGRYREIQRVSVVGSLQGYSAVRCGMRCDWALLGYSKVEHCKDFLALQGYFAIGHCGILCGWALAATLCSSALRRIFHILWLWHSRDTFRVAHCLVTLPLGTAGIPCGWDRQG